MRLVHPILIAVLVLVIGCATAALAGSAAQPGAEASTSNGTMTGSQRVWLAGIIAVLFFVGVLVVYAGLWLARARALPGLEAAEVVNIFRATVFRESALHMLTVALIIDAVLILAVIGQIPSQSATSVLAAIAGYVLGSMQKGGTNNSTNGATSPQQSSDKQPSEEEPSGPV